MIFVIQVTVLSGHRVSVSNMWHYVWWIHFLVRVSVWVCECVCLGCVSVCSWLRVSVWVFVGVCVCVWVSVWGSSMSQSVRRINFSSFLLFSHSNLKIFRKVLSVEWGWRRPYISWFSSSCWVRREIPWGWREIPLLFPLAYPCALFFLRISIYRPRLGVLNFV